MDIRRCYVGMRRFILLMCVGFMIAAYFISSYETEEPPFLEKLEKAMNNTNMLSYRDPFYGYVVRYPSFFEQVPDSLVDERGCCQFRLWNVEKIVQTAFVIPNTDSLTLEEGMERFARELHATECRSEADYFILSGPLYMNDGIVNGQSCHAKYVRHQKLWFVQLLAYPDSCAQAVTRLVKQIDDWNVWEEEGQEKYRIPQSRRQRRSRTKPVQWDRVIGGN